MTRVLILTIAAGFPSASARRAPARRRWPLQPGKMQPPPGRADAPSGLVNASLEAASAARSAKLAEFTERRFARALHVPVDDAEVRLALRARGEPTCLFGEDAHDRRERLRALLAREALSAHAPAPPAAPPGGGAEATGAAPAPAAPTDGGGGDDDEYYTEGAAALRALRAALARASLAAANARLRRERGARAEGESGPLRAASRRGEHAAVERARASRLRASQRSGGRPLCGVAVRGGAVATASWGGGVELWDARSAQRRGGVLAHDARVSMLDFPADDALLTAGTDGRATRVRVAADGALRVAHVFDGHVGRVSAARAHPLRGDVVATVGFDGALRVYQGETLVAAHRTGHARVTWLDCHPDGALLASTGSEGGVRVWDLRSGRVLLTLEKAHVGEAFRVAFSGDGRTFASAGGDHVAAVWDLRKRGSVKRIAAHTGIISGLQFAGGTDAGDVLATASFDGTVKMWAARRDFALLQAHTAHEDKVMAMDMTPDVSMVVTACYDKTWKSWTP